MARATREYFDLLDGVWEDVSSRLPQAFTTQRFQYLLNEIAPGVWARFVEKWGPGGRGSGKFYSPANVLNNYLKEKTRNGVLLNRGFVPSEKGWGSPKVHGWTFIEPASETRAEAETIPHSEQDWQFAEGKPEWKLHLVRERAADVRKELLKSRAAKGLSCDICDTKADHLPEELRDSLFEAHHSSAPVAKGERITRKEDVALLCACCHRLIHRLVSKSGKWVTVPEAKALLRQPAVLQA